MTRLDAIDLKILATLRAEGRITKAALAAAVNLSRRRAGSGSGAWSDRA